MNFRAKGSSNIGDLSNAWYAGKEGERVITTVSVIGDSASAGFATGGRSYPVLVSEMLGAEHLELLVKFGKTTRIALDHDADLVAAHKPDLILLQIGPADALVHPGQRLQRMIERFAPPTWHGVDGLERRAVFDQGRRRRVQQHLTAAVKTTLKRVLVTVSGYTRMQPDEYGACLDQLLTRLEAISPLVVCLGFFPADDRYFPRQTRSFATFAAVRHAVLARHPAVIAVEPEQVLRCWDDYLGDHGHWNAAGHARVADLVVARVRETHPDVDPMPASPGVS
jgi:lysophospholipase L1-like esterase